MQEVGGQDPRGSSGGPGTCSWDLGDAGTRAKFVLHDRDASFTQASGAVFLAGGIWVIRSSVQAPRMNSIMERWIGSCRRELLDRTLIWNPRHLMMVLGEYEVFCNSHRPHRALNQAAPLRGLPHRVTDLDHFWVRRHDRAGGVIHGYRLVHRFSAPTGSPLAVTAVLLTPGDDRADWLRAGQALQRLLAHAASEWVFASLYSQPLEAAAIRALIRDRLALPGAPQMLLQLGLAHAQATARRPASDLIEP